MLRHVVLCVPFFLLGCASTHTSAVVVDETIEARSAPVATELPSQPSTEAGIELFAPTTMPASETSFAEPAARLLTPAAEDEGLHGSRFTAKLGYWGATEDELDDGYIAGVSWMTFFTRLFALELETGYVDVEGDDAGVDLDVWALPVMINGRVNLPVWVLEAYGGLGVGGFYYDADASGAASGSDDGFLLGGNAFLGASINLAEAIALGLEFKYYVTEDADDVDAGLDAYALMLTLGFSR